MRKPNPSNVTNALLNALPPTNPISQPTDAIKIHDVVLQTSDNHKIPALKPLLALRSPFFSRLFYGPFSESTSSTVTIDLPQRSLSQVLHFIYADESPVLRRLDDAIRRSYGGSKLRRKAWGALRCRDIESAVGIVAAADYCQINVLTEWGCRLIMKAIRVKQGLACVALHAIVERGGVCDKLAQVQEVVLKYIVRYAPGCFAAPRRDEGRPLALRECFGYAGKCGLMHLGEDAIKLVFERMKNDESEFLSMTVTFDALHYWGTGGKSFEQVLEGDKGTRLAAKGQNRKRKDEQSGKGHEKDARQNMRGSSAANIVNNSNDGTGQQSITEKTPRRVDTYKQTTRWKTAMACAAIMRAPAPHFLVDVLEPSGLLSQDVLFTFYRDITWNTAVLDRQDRLGAASVDADSSDERDESV